MDVKENMLRGAIAGASAVKTQTVAARRKMSETMAAFMMNRPAPYAEAFRFEVPRKSMIDPDASSSV